MTEPVLSPATDSPATLLNVEQVAAILKCSPRHVYRMSDDGGDAVTSTSERAGPLVPHGYRSLDESWLSVLPLLQRGDAMKRSSKTEAAVQRKLFENDDAVVSRRRSQVERAELKFLKVLREYGEATTDVIPDDLATAYPDNGTWVGSIPRRLLSEKLIVETACARSNRPKRHRGRIGLYAVLDRAAIDRRIALLQLRLTAGE